MTKNKSAGGRKWHLTSVSRIENGEEFLEFKGMCDHNSVIVATGRIYYALVEPGIKFKESGLSSMSAMMVSLGYSDKPASVMGHWTIQGKESRSAN